MLGVRPKVQALPGNAGAGPWLGQARACHSAPSPGHPCPPPPGPRAAWCAEKSPSLGPQASMDCSFRIPSTLEQKIFSHFGKFPLKQCPALHTLHHLVVFPEPVWLCSGLCPPPNPHDGLLKMRAVCVAGRQSDDIQNAGRGPTFLFFGTLTPFPTTSLP